MENNYQETVRSHVNESSKKQSQSSTQDNLGNGLFLSFVDSLVSNVND